MTITRIDRLIRRVRATLQTSDPGGAQLAAEFADICREANRRLEQCLGSMRRGDLAGTLDLSDAEPALPEQIRILSFPEFEAWVQRCREQGWEVPETPDGRGFQTLQKGLMEKRGKEADPALVNSYRAAMVAGDRSAALRALTSILRHRPGDSWATAEKKKLLTKESEISLRRLESLLAGGKDGALIAEVDQFEKLGLDPKMRPEIYEAARNRRAELRREEAQRKVEEQLGQAEAKRESNQWREVEEWLEQASSDLEEAGARPPSGHRWNDLHQWVRDKRTQEARREQLQKQEERVMRELEALEQRRQEKARRSPGRLEEALTLVKEFLGMSGTEGVVWPEAVHQRLRREEEFLVADLRAAKKRRWMMVVGILLGIGLGLAGFVQWKQEEIRQQIFLGKIGQMIESRQVEEARAWLESEEAKRAALQAGGAAHLAKLRAFLEAEEQCRRSLEEELVSLEKNITEKKVPWAEQLRSGDDFKARLQKLYPPWRPPLEDRLNLVMKSLRERCREFQDVRARSLRASLKRVELEFSAWERINRNGKDDAEKLQPLLDQLSDGMDWQREDLPELAIPEDLGKEVQIWATRLADRKIQIEQYAQVQQSLGKADSLSEYRAALARYEANTCISSTDKEKISQVLAAWRECPEVAMGLWLPWISHPPSSLNGGTAQLMPSHLSPAEDNLLKEIVDDDFLNDIWRYQVPDSISSTNSHVLYSQGKLKEIPGTGSNSAFTLGEGEVFIPQGHPREMPVKFEKRPRTQSFRGITQDMDELLIGFRSPGRVVRENNSQRLKTIRDGLDRALSSEDSSVLHRAPIQSALQELLPNEPGTSPLARAYLALKVWKLATVGKDPTRFGLLFSPSLQKATSPWDSWIAVEPGSWLKEDVSGLDPDWVRAFSQLEKPNFVEESKLTAQLWRRAGRESVSFVGAVSSEGKGNFERLVNVEPGQILVGQGLKGELVVGWRFDGKKWVEDAKVRAFSPLYLVPRNPENLLFEAAREARVDTGWAKEWVRRFLPLLFGGGEGGSRH